VFLLTGSLSCVTWNWNHYVWLRCVALSIFCGTCERSSNRVNTEKADEKERGEVSERWVRGVRKGEGRRQDERNQEKRGEVSPFLSEVNVSKVAETNQDVQHSK
jgi:hypothetical protein